MHCLVLAQILNKHVAGFDNLLHFQDPRKRPPEKHIEEDEEEEERRLREESGLSRSGRLFGGLINDVKRKAPW